MDEATLIEIVQEHLCDPDTRALALRSKNVSRSLVYRLERRLYLNPGLDRYIELCTLIGLDVYAFSVVCDRGERWSEELRRHCTIQEGSISRFARRHNLVRQSVNQWCCGTHFPRLRVALRVCELLDSHIVVRERM
ncbi:MAG: hypothetical protein H6713_05745 [Myxococcales bacterium]|nr:hypothetical protein [Myxococcales bacterium]